MGIKTQLLNEIKSKSKLKKDGVYSYRGWFYRVKNGETIFVADKISLHVYQIAHGLLVRIGKGKERYTLKKELTKL